MVGGLVLDFTRLMLISTQVEVVVEVGVELGKMEGWADLIKKNKTKKSWKFVD